jgi:two-component system LytT family response regulator
LQSIREPAAINRIALPTLEGLQMLVIDTILYCMANSNYTSFVMKDKKRLVISRTLKEVEEMLEPHGFLRIHHSHLVNVSAIEKYIRGEGGTVVMVDGTQLDVSRSRKESLLKLLQARR